MCIRDRIDIVEWSEDPLSFVTNAISPAKVQRVSVVDDQDRIMEVIVEDKQLSLAIGKKGQNVRLAAKLTGWKIDIKSEEEKRREVEAQFEGLELGGSGDAGSQEPSSEGGASDESTDEAQAAAPDQTDEVVEAAADTDAAEASADADAPEQAHKTANAE